MLLRADDIVHDDASPVKARIERKAFRGSEFLYTLRLASGERVLAHVPSHHDHQVGEWIGIRAEVDHVVTFERAPAAAPDRRDPGFGRNPPRRGLNFALASQARIEASVLYCRRSGFTRRRVYDGRQIESCRLRWPWVRWPAR